MRLESRSDSAIPRGASERARRPRYQQIKEVLRQRIIDGFFAGDQRLPSESQLMATFGVSRVTIRHALRSLCADGLIESIHGKGYFLLKPRIVLDLDRLSGLGAVATLQGHKINSRDIAVTQKRADTDTAKTLWLARDEQVFELARVRLLNGEPFVFQVSFLPLALGKRISRENLENADLMAMFERDLRIALGVAEASIEVIAADMELSQRLLVAKDAPIVLMTRLIKTADGQPLVFERLYARTDICRFAAQLPRRRDSKRE